MNIVKNLSRDELVNLVNSNNSYASIMSTLGLAISGDSVKLLRDRIKSEGLNTSHFNKNKISKNKIQLDVEVVHLNRRKAIRNYKAP